MQDFICVNSFKRSKRSVSEQKVIEVDNIKKCIRMQKDVLKGFLSLYTQNDLNLMRINEKKKNSSDFSIKNKPINHSVSSPYLSSTLTISSNKIGILEKVNYSKKNKIFSTLDKTRPLVFQIPRLNTTNFDLKLYKPQKPFDIWKFRNSIHVETKVFIIIGNYPDLRSALLKRG